MFWPFMEEADISSEKVAVTSVVRSTPLASLSGTVLLAVGSVVSVRDRVDQPVRACRSWVNIPGRVGGPHT